MKKNILLFGCLLFMFQIGTSQTFDKEKLDSYFEALEDNDKFMGSVALMKDGEILYKKSIGFSDIESNKKNNNETKYRVGSISKTFTATLVLKAIEEGLLDISNTIDRYFPKIENAKSITIKNLLNHRSGIHNFTNDASYLTYNTEMLTKDQMVDIIIKSGSDFTPGSKAEYSNSNYVLLSYILEEIYQKAYGQILQEKIISPLNLKNTYFGDVIKLDDNESNSYRYLGDWVKQTETHTSIPMGAGGIVSTSTDLLVFINALFKVEIISQESINTMKTITDGYGLGLFPMPFNEAIALGHNGGIDGFSSVFGYFQNENIGFALISNGQNYNTNAILITMLSSVFNSPYEIPTFKTIALSTEDLDAYIGTYSSNDLPIKFTFTKSDTVLKVQATGQPEISLNATDTHTFKFEQAGVTFVFNTEKNEIEFTQSGMRFILTKE